MESRSDLLGVAAAAAVTTRKTAGPDAPSLEREKRMTTVVLYEIQMADRPTKNDYGPRFQSSIYAT